MPRWEPDAPGRLLQAALDLFGERGYDATTAAQIAERAGLTKTTLFRLFADKREVLFQGQPASVALVTGGIETAPPQATPYDALWSGILALCAAHVPEQQEIGRRVEALVQASPELRERAVSKRAAIASAAEQALVRRTQDPRLAGVLADLGIRAYYDGFMAWTGERRSEDLVTIVQDELSSLVDVLPLVRAGEDGRAAGPP